LGGNNEQQTNIQYWNKCLLSGDDTNHEGYGKITSHMDDYLGGLQFEVTLEDGRVLYDVTPADFEGKEVLGKAGAPEFQMVSTWETELETWGNLEGEELGYKQENSVTMNLAY
jgi:hypothetical protein